MGKSFEDIKLEDAFAFIENNVDAVVLIDSEADTYKTLVKNNPLFSMIDETGNYGDLVQKLWFHLGKNQETVSEDYQVFIPTFGKFTGKYNKRLKLVKNETTHIVEATIYPYDDRLYILILNELDNSEYMRDFLTSEKITTIQNTYLFSMYIDLFRDSTSSISITEISDDTMHGELKYSEWRMMIVNMIWPDDQQMFLERTDPQYLKKNLMPGRTSSFDCLMQNLEGKYIWVKLTFSRAETNNSEEDFRYVFMVQDIHENSVQLMSTLKKYEELASKDALTDVFNHGRIETEIYNAIEIVGRTDRKVSMMMFDIDFFKSVNDKFGHAVGDMTLKHFAYMIKDYFKKSNVVLGRWGGEEFVAVCYDADIEKVTAYAEEIREKVSCEEFKIAGAVTVSTGLTEIKKEDSFSAAFDRMDKALYKAKNEGRNRVESLN
ncbi:MAG: GGDEF domain-containing protein [Lachnospiraceae bacterium]|nr:GGDEF domain-containing protein [Lachnospiraceae bacterium]